MQWFEWALIVGVPVVVVCGSIAFHLWATNDIDMRYW